MEAQLRGEAASRVQELEHQIAQLQSEGRFSDAIAPAREATEIRTRLQGADHWQTVDARCVVDDLRKIAALPEEGRKAMMTSRELQTQAVAERQRGHYAEAERIYRTLLEVRRKWLGDRHPHTAASDNDVADMMFYQGKYAEAEPLYRKALAIDLKTLGENQPNTADQATTTSRPSWMCRGSTPRPRPLYSQGLAIRLKALGENHTDTANEATTTSRTNLAIRASTPRPSPSTRKALAIWLKARGENQPRYRPKLP